MANRSTLNDNLPPRISVDTGSRRTAVIVGIGDAYVAGTVLLNDEPHAANGKWAVPVSPEFGYGDAIVDVIDKALNHKPWRDQAVAWWAQRGVVIPDDATPFIQTVEKINHPNRRRGKPVTVIEYGSTFGAHALAVGVWMKFDRRARVVTIPFNADTGWSREFGGSGRLADYYPAPLVEPVLRPDLFPDGIYPDGWLDGEDLSQTGAKDLVAAWDVGQRAAARWVERSHRLTRSLRVLGPHEEPGVAASLLRDDRDYLARWYGRQPSLRVA
ncbi:hypothetical protein [Knoellia sp. LjRoot47]|uniref:hypothetical protein n=1 Tax=Knoellia sp. LjRoot47 TaxID=3342330 RepID=UPI003ECC503A